VYILSFCATYDEITVNSPLCCGRKEAEFFTLVILFLDHFCRAMHFSAKRGIAIACCLSVCDVGEL